MIVSEKISNISVKASFIAYDDMVVWSRNVLIENARDLESPKTVVNVTLRVTLLACNVALHPPLDHFLVSSCTRKPLETKIVAII